MVHRPRNAHYLESYSYTLQSSFGTPPYSYQITSGSLPSGLNMNSSGAISGTATALGKFHFQVLATDSSQPAQKQSSSYTLNVVIGMDEYGGLTAAPVPGCTPTGYFQLQKVKVGSNPARWVYADPLCNAFYSLSVYDSTSYFIYGTILQSHYGNDSNKWATHELNREVAYGYNANDIFYNDYVLPIPKGGNSSGATPQLPFILFFGSDQDAVFNPGAIGLPEALKNIIGGQDQIWLLRPVEHLQHRCHGSQLDGSQPGRTGAAAQSGRGWLPEWVQQFAVARSSFPGRCR